MKKAIFSFVLSLAALYAFAQNNRHWGTYYGGTRTDNGYSVAYDKFGNIYIAGSTNDTATNPLIIPFSGFQNKYGGGSSDAFLAKFDSSGTRIWATYYGGNGDDRGYAVAADSSGNVYLAGITTSTDSVAIWQNGMVNSFQGGTYDGFLAKFDANGNRQWGTYFGRNFSAYPQCLAVDGSGNVYMGGYASDTAGIATVGAYQTTNAGGTYDAFLTKFNPNGLQLWGTYFGGGGNDGANPVGAAVAVVGVGLDAAGNIYLCGNTSSTSGIASSNGVHQSTNGGNGDGFLAKFNANGSRIWSTYYGGGQADQCHSVAADGVKIYLSGRTQSNSAIATSNGYDNTYGGGGNSDAFLVRFDSAGVRVWGTYYGDQGSEFGYSVTVDQRGNIYQAGRTSSTTSIASSDGFQTAYGTNTDAYVVKFDSNGSRYCATYLGGSGGDQGYGIAISQGKIYITGFTASSSSIASVGSHDDTFGGSGNNDAFLVKFSSCIYDSIQSVNAVCFGSCDGMATAFGYGGTQVPYSYLWSDGQTTQSATGLCAGSYTVTIWDAYGNSTMDSVVITEPTQISVITFSNPATCGSSDGSAGANASNGVPPYTYAWTPSGQTTQAATGLAAGIYTVVVTDANDCTAAATATVSNSSTLNASITSQTDVSCFGGNDGSATVTANLGNPPYTYAWFPSGGSSSTATGLSAGNYNCKVTDASNCQVIVAVTINEPAQLTVSMSGNVTICSGSSTPISATVLGGTTAYTYVWVPATGLNDNTISNPVASPTVTTTYSVLVTDANSCTIIGGLVVTVAATPTALVSGSSTICSGSTAVLNASGGTSYSWNTGATTASISDTPASTTSYTVIVSNGNCSDTAVHTVTVTLPPSLNASSTDATCGSNDGTATANVTGGNPPYTYQWNPTGQTTLTATGLGVGIYTVTVIDASGCIQTDQVTVNNNTTLSALVTSQTDATCFGGSNGSATVTASAGTSPYTFAWSPSGGSSSAATGLSAGNYTCTVTDANSCVVFATVIINQPAQLMANTSGNTAVCGDSVMISSSPTGGTGAYTYVWVPSTGLNDNTISNPMAFPSSNTTYSVLVTDANGCTAVGGLLVSVTNPPVATITGNTVVCAGGSATLTAQGGSSYMWSTGATTSTIVVSPTTTTNYSVVVSNGGNCSDSAAVTVTSGASPNVIVIANDASCSTCPDGSATAFTSGGVQPYTYLWTPSGQTTLTATGLAPGTYTVCVTGSNGCTECDSVTVSFPIGLPMPLQASSVSVYPNPFSRETFVSIPALSQYNCSLSIYDMIGNEMSVLVERKQNGFSIGRAQLKQGIYFIKVMEGNKIITTKKLVVE